eukprot:4542543-Pleurochrysis_carterae.AAC.3
MRRAKKLHAARIEAACGARADAAGRPRWVDEYGRRFGGRAQVGGRESRKLGNKFSGGKEPLRGGLRQAEGGDATWRDGHEHPPTRRRIVETTLRL